MRAEVGKDGVGPTESPILWGPDTDGVRPLTWHSPQVLMEALRKAEESRTAALPAQEQPAVAAA